ncbi:MAG TPA: hypothetical protein DEA08_24855 [Planctomycetes bacterium]|nr:hypothetical protein [Planctomycetota bacterium]
MTETCEHVLEALGAALELSEAEGEHLAKCSDCKAFAASLERLDAIFAAEPLPEPPLDLVESVMTRVAERQEAELRWARGRLALLLTAAVLLAACALGFGELGAGISLASEWELSLGLSERFLEGLEVVRGQASAWSGTLTPPEDLAGAWLFLVALSPLLLVLNWFFVRRWEIA